MNNVQWLVGAFLGMLVGILLYRLPFRLFYRHATWVTEDEFLTALPEKRWVTRSLYGLVPVQFFLFVVLMTSADRMKGPIISFFFFPVFFCCVGAVPAVPELLARASVQIPVGHGSRSPVLYTLSPNAARAGVFRLATASLVVATFLWCR